MACLLWILGFELGPNVHLALHESLGHHHHTGDGVAHADAVEPDAAADHHEAAHEHGHHHDADHHAEHHHAEHHHDVDAGHHHEADHHEADHHEADHHEADHHEADRLAADRLAAYHDRLAETDPDPVERAHCLQTNGHGRHALAHRGLAVQTTPPAWPTIASAPVAGTVLVAPSAQPPRSLQPRHVRARGPPTATV